MNKGEPVAEGEQAPQEGGENKEERAVPPPPPAQERPVNIPADGAWQESFGGFTDNKQNGTLFLLFLSLFLFLFSFVHLHHHELVLLIAYCLLAGPESIGFDISFIGSKHVYGLPEHSTGAALRNTKYGIFLCLFIYFIFNFFLLLIIIFFPFINFHKKG